MIAIKPASFSAEILLNLLLFFKIKYSVLDFFDRAVCHRIYKVLHQLHRHQPSRFAYLFYRLTLQAYLVHEPSSFCASGLNMLEVLNDKKDKQNARDLYATGEGLCISWADSPIKKI